MPPIRPQQQPQPQPFRTTDVLRDPRALPPPPSSRADRPASAADFDQIMLSIGALTGRFDEVKKEITGIAGRLDGHAGQLATLVREATEDQANVVDLTHIMDERADELSQTLSEDCKALPDLVRKAIDERLAEVGVTDLGGSVAVLPPSCQAMSNSREERYLLAR